MGLETSRYGSYCRLRFEGEMTADAVENIRAEWLDMLEHCHAMEIDLTRARCIDLSGVQLMLRMRDEAKQADKMVLFIGWNPAIEEALHVYHWFVDLIGSGRCRSQPMLAGGTA